MRWSWRSFKKFVYKKVSRLNWEVMPNAVRIYAAEKYLECMLDSIDKDIQIHKSEQKNISNALKRLKDRDDSIMTTVLADMRKFKETSEVIEYTKNSTKFKSKCSAMRIVNRNIKKEEAKQAMKALEITSRNESRANLVLTLEQFRGKKEHENLDKELEEMYADFNTNYTLEKKPVLGQKSEHEQQFTEKLASVDDEVQDIIQMEQSKESEENQKFERELGEKLMKIWSNQSSSSSSSKKSSNKKIESSKILKEDIEVEDEYKDDESLLRNNGVKKKKKHGTVIMI